MEAENAAKLINEVLTDRVEKSGSSLAEGSRNMGESPGYLSCQKNRPRGLRVQDTMVCLKAVKVPIPEEAFHEAFFSEPKDPSAILRYSRENQKLKPDPLLVELKPLLEDLATAGPTPGEWDSVAEEIRDLDHLRRRDRQAAYSQLGRLVLELMGKLKSDSRPRAAFADLTSALGVLAAILRLAGHRDDSVEILALSWPLALHAKNPFTRAEWYQKAAYLLTDLYRYCRAESFLEKAYMLFGIADARSEQLAVLVDFGYILTEAGRHGESLEHLNEILPMLEEIAVRYRVSAHHLLAVNYHSLGNLDAAKAHSRYAIDLIGDNLLAKAYCIWRLGEQLIASNDLSDGFACFDQAIPLFVEQVGEPTLIAQLILNYASALIEHSYFSQLSELDAHLSMWYSQSKRNLKLRNQIEEFRALIKLDKLTSLSFAEVRQRIIPISRRRS